MTRVIPVLLALCLPVSANALNVFSCEPEWAALVEELAGDNVEITQATTAFQDPHMLQARPSLIAKARRADLLGSRAIDDVRLLRRNDHVVDSDGDTGPRRVEEAEVLQLVDQLDPFGSGLTNAVAFVFGP